jgi:GrpB-like predicted nucleotidyltransferase (UPF0157 family)
VNDTELREVIEMSNTHTMLTEGQQKYLASLPDNMQMTVKPWNPEALDIANSIISRIHTAVPELEIKLLGSVPLKIAGQEDIDISVFCVKSDQEKHVPAFTSLFGEPSHRTNVALGWDFQQDGYSVSVWLTDPSAETTRQQVKIFDLLKDNPILLNEYEHIKLDAKDLPYKEYQQRKYEFYNRVLD